MKVIIHHGMDSAYDRTARNLLYNFMLRNYKKKHSALKHFLKTNDPKTFNAFAIIAPDQIFFHKTLDEAYSDALNHDCERPSFVRVWRDGDTQNYMCAPETALFGGYDGEIYSDDYRLKQEVKDLAIKLIKEQLKTPDSYLKQPVKESFPTAP